MSYYQGRVAVVTGAASGMGRALALKLAGAGAEVAICDVDEAGLAGTVAREHGRVHFVFNNAGVDVNAPVTGLTYDDFEWLMSINFWGVVHGCKAFLPHLQQAGFGHIVNTSSIFGLITVPNQSAYHAAKFAVRGFSECLRQELADQNIRVSWVMPGGVKTNVVRNSRYRASDNQAPTKEEAARAAGSTSLTASAALRACTRPASCTPAPGSPPAPRSVRPARAPARRAMRDGGWESPEPGRSRRQPGPRRSPGHATAP
jgi:NAD(P)-dependent dehydrogenase (short-subunit alcohol dehydrogenase family)